MLPEWSSIRTEGSRTRGLQERRAGKLLLLSLRDKTTVELTSPQVGRNTQREADNLTTGWRDTERER